MIKACNIEFMDRDWVCAAQSHASMRACASFEHVVNFSMPCGSLARNKQNCRLQYCRDACGNMVRDATVWIGTRSCDFAPGGLVVDALELPIFVRRAKTLRIVEEDGGCYRLVIVDDEERRHTWHARTSCGTFDGTLLDLLSVGSQPLPSTACLDSIREAFRLHGKAQSPFMEDFARSPSVDGRMSKELVANGMLFCDLMASSAASSRAMSLVLSRIVGLGVGLTPSGDDFIIGALAIARAFSLSGGLGYALVEIVDMLAQNTTRISQHYLMSAVRGRFSQSVIDAVHAVLCGDLHMSTGASEASFRTLLNHGSTSGTDTLAGMVAMLQACSCSFHQDALSASAMRHSQFAS